MHFEGEFIIDAPREEVWGYISNPQSALDYVPNIRKLNVLSENKFTATVGVGVGSIRGNFDLEFEVVENIPPIHTKLKAKGSGLKSIVDFETAIDLSATPNGKTNTKWLADANVGGLIAGVGQRLLRMVAEKTVNELFDRLRSKLEK